MARIGLSKPYFAKYNYDGQQVTYSGGALMGKAVQMDIELEGADDNVLYCDNGPGESENTFAGGTCKLTTDELMPSVLLEILGVVEEAIENASIKTEDAKWYIWNDDQDTPYLGVGAIVMIQKDNKRKYQAVVLTKLQFTNPNDSFKTKGETVEWGTPEITGNLLRDDTEKHEWKRISSPMDTEADAEEAIKALFGITTTAATTTTE